MRLGRLTDNMAFVAIYSLVAMAVVIPGASFTANYAIDTIFFNNYLRPWEMLLVELRHRTVAWPDYATGDPGAYMQALVEVVKAAGLTPPQSNTGRDYIYQLNKIGERLQPVFLVGTVEQMHLFNLPASTFKRLDRLIDGQSGPAAGRFTGTWSTDGVTYIAHWRI
jgi:hypothetical protein